MINPTTFFDEFWNRPARHAVSVAGVLMQVSKLQKKVSNDNSKVEKLWIIAFQRVIINCVNRINYVI